jgi:signal transduction histidine kinase/ActR/RegA family two-component response regulator
LRRAAEAQVKQRRPTNPPPTEAERERLQHELEVHQVELELQNASLQAIQAELQTALERYTELYEFAPVGYLSLGPDGEIRQLNLAAATLLGTERSHLVSRRLGQFVSLADRAAFADFLQGAFAGQQAGTCEVSLAEGAPPMVVRLDVASESSGQECLAVLTNITEQKRAEERARQAHKLEAVSHLTGGVAHEFNNILAAIVMGLGLAKTAGPLGEDPELLAVMEGSCERAAGLVRQLLAASRQSMLCRQSLDLADMVTRHMQALHPQIEEGIRVEFTSPPSLSRVTADGALLEQVLQSLCQNAREAMRNGGVLRVDLREEAVGVEREKTHLDAKAGRFVRLTVSDTGCGMEDQTRRRLFEPFFTTKNVAHSAGMSLAAVQGIVRQHQGWVEVESQVGQGSTFRVYLPVEVPTEGAVVKTSPAKSGAGANGTILLVEDEESLRKLTGKFLTRLGYPVLEAADGAAALEVWAAHAAEIGLIFTDMVIPGELSGLDVARQVMAQKPGLKAIITSGYYMHKYEADVKQSRASGIIYLPKPCSFHDLAAAVRSFLGSRVAPASQSNAVMI